MQTDKARNHTIPLNGRPGSYSLIDALLNRRSRRFGRGLALEGGPLAWKSEKTPVPLTMDQEAALVFAASGITGPTFAELPYQPGSDPESGDGNILMQFVGRTVASGDAAHCVALFVINDDGAWMVKRPQDFPPHQIASITARARSHAFGDLYQDGRIRLAADRVDIPRELPFIPSFNKWSANREGTSYFLPIAELTGFYINILLTAFSDAFAYFLVDDHNKFRPAGLGAFGRSRGGHLHDDPGANRLATVTLLESWLYEFAAIEQGGMLQNLGLMTQALGLGGFPHFAAHPFIWMERLGFRMQDVPLSRIMGAGRLVRSAMRALGRDTPVPTAVGLERDGEMLIKPFCPPYYRSMEEAVHAFVDAKFKRDEGVFRDGGAHLAWKDGRNVQAGIPEYAPGAIDATVAYCEYIYSRYGRFPANSGPFRSVLAYQAHNLDEEFYETFYKAG